MHYIYRGFTFVVKLYYKIYSKKISSVKSQHTSFVITCKTRKGGLVSLGTDRIYQSTIVSHEERKNFVISHSLRSTDASSTDVVKCAILLLYQSPPLPPSVPLPFTNTAEQAATAVSLEINK